MTSPSLTVTADSGTPSGVRKILSVMMFLQYFIQGCYLPIVSLYLQDSLGFSTADVGYFGAALAIGPLFAPFVVGQLVDRRYSTERVLAFSHLCGGLIMLGLYLQSAFWPVMVLGTLYSILYVPTLMLTNSLAFAHLLDRDREFPIVRLFGTIGFIVPAWLIETVFLKGLTGEDLNAARGIALASAGVAGLVMAVFCLKLPHTPPAGRDRSDLAPLVAIRMAFGERHFLVLVLTSFVIAIVHKFYFVLNTPYLRSVLDSGGIQEAYEQRISSLGQIGEIAVMAGLGLLLKRIGFKRTLLLGITAYWVRCLIFGLVPRLELAFAAELTLVCFGQLVHGVCFGCFLAAAFIYFDRMSPPDVRGSMQNLYGTFVLGIGFFAGGLVSGGIGQYFTSTVDGGMVRDWFWIWNSAGLMALVSLLAFAAFFPATQRLPGEADGELALAAAETEDAV